MRHCTVQFSIKNNYWLHTRRRVPIASTGIRSEEHLRRRQRNGLLTRRKKRESRRKSIDRVYALPESLSIQMGEKTGHGRRRVQRGLMRACAELPHVGVLRFHISRNDRLQFVASTGHIRIRASVHRRLLGNARRRRTEHY